MTISAVFGRSGNVVMMLLRERRKADARPGFAGSSMAARGVAPRYARA
jgi:hypothetical protein